MTPSTCPSRNELRAYLVGELSESDGDQVADHVKACSHCQGEMATIDDTGDTLIGQIRSPRVEDGFSQESGCQLAMVRAMSAAGAAVGEEPVSTAVLTDSLLGEYRLLNLLGRGGMGTVYRALHTRLDREVAIKLLPHSRWEDECKRRRESVAGGGEKVRHRNQIKSHRVAGVNSPTFVCEWIAVV